ncbi:MAG TPA: hypothetical protein VHI93_09150 [Candidatus Thermoplasmatota archaeon]|nr:hypothetical protein [Candidatus Thermoplasmatota archaeon]
MRTSALALPLLLLAAAPAPSAATTDVTVTLAVNASLTFPYDEPAFTLAPCSVTVPAGSDGGVVLDAAAASGCVGGWEAIDDPAFGRFVHGITQAGSADSTDGRNEYTARFLCGAAAANPGGSLLFAAWGFGLNGAASSTGIDDYAAAAGDALVFHYIVDSCAVVGSLTFIFTGLWPTLPIPVEGDCRTDPGAL